MLHSEIRARRRRDWWPVGVLLRILGRGHRLSAEHRRPRPYFSWVSFIPPAYEVTILFAALTAAGSMLLLNGLPRHHHPVFNVPRFSRASQDGFFLAIEASDPKFNIEQTRAFLDQLNPREVVAFDE